MLDINEINIFKSAIKIVLQKELPSINEIIHYFTDINDIICRINKKNIKFIAPSNIHINPNLLLAPTKDIEKKIRIYKYEIKPPVAKYTNIFNKYDDESINIYTKIKYKIGSPVFHLNQNIIVIIIEIIKADNSLNIPLTIITGEHEDKLKIITTVNNKDVVINNLNKLSLIILLGDNPFLGNLHHSLLKSIQINYKLNQVFKNKTTPLYKNNDILLSVVIPYNDSEVYDFILYHRIIPNLPFFIKNNILNNTYIDTNKIYNHDYPPIKDKKTNVKTNYDTLKHFKKFPQYFKKFIGYIKPSYYKK